MPSYDMKELAQIIQDAISLTQSLPETSRGAILLELVKYMLDSTYPDQNVPDPSAEAGKTGEEEIPKENSPFANLQGWKAELLEGLPEAHEAANGSRQQQAMWAVISLTSGDEVADLNSVTTTIKDMLGVTPESRDNTSATLGKLVPKYLSREKEGRYYMYQPTRHALGVFKEKQ